VTTAASFHDYVSVTSTIVTSIFTTSFHGNFSCAATILGPILAMLYRCTASTIPGSIFPSFDSSFRCRTSITAFGSVDIDRRISTTIRAVRVGHRGGRSQTDDAASAK
jgi:hypothetical protein